MFTCHCRAGQYLATIIQWVLRCLRFVCELALLPIVPLCGVNAAFLSINASPFAGVECDMIGQCVGDVTGDVTLDSLAARTQLRAQYLRTDYARHDVTS